MEALKAVGQCGTTQPLAKRMGVAVQGEGASGAWGGVMGKADCSVKQGGQRE